MATQHQIISRELKAGDAVSTVAHELLSNWSDVPASWTGTDVTLTAITDDNHGDSYLTEWSDGSAFDIHPGLKVTVSRG